MHATLISAAAKVNAPWHLKISPTELKACLDGSIPTEPWAFHLGVLFEEYPLAKLAAWISEEGIPIAAVAAAYSVQKSLTGQSSPSTEAWLASLGAAV